MANDAAFDPILAAPYAEAIARIIDGDEKRALPPTVGAPSWFGPLLAKLLDAPPNLRLDAYSAFINDSPDGPAIVRLVSRARFRLQHEHPVGPELPRLWPHDELLGEPFDPTRWRLVGIIPADGLAVLAGRKKTGKSWLALEIAQTVAQGIPFLDRPTAQTPVVYVCLEDGAPRLQSRLQRQQAQPGLPITYCFGPLYPLDGDEGHDQLQALIARTNCGLLILDTFAAARSARADENDAAAMAAITNRLRETARSQRCSILLVAHHGKKHGGDAGDDIRGSSAIGAASDANLGLYRSPTGYALHVEGRDMPETSFPLALDAETMRWHSATPSAPPPRPTVQEEIIAALTDLGLADAATLAAHLDRDRARLSVTLAAMAREGSLVMVEERGDRGAPRKLYRPP